MYLGALTSCVKYSAIKIRWYAHLTSKILCSDKLTLALFYPKLLMLIERLQWTREYQLQLSASTWVFCWAIQLQYFPSSLQFEFALKPLIITLWRFYYAKERHHRSWETKKTQGMKWKQREPTECNQHGDGFERKTFIAQKYLAIFLEIMFCTTLCSSIMHPAI